jgi:hypothetical protein
MSSLDQAVLYSFQVQNRWKEHHEKTMGQIYEDYWFDCTQQVFSVDAQPLPLVNFNRDMLAPFSIDSSRPPDSMNFSRELVSPRFHRVQSGPFRY